MTEGVGAGRLNPMSTMVPVPHKLLEKFRSAAEHVRDAEDEIEDYLFARSPSFVKKLRAARRDHLRGRTRPFPLARPK